MTIEFIESIENKAVFRRIFTTKSRTRKGIKKALGKIGRDLKSEFKKQVNSQDKTGKVYAGHRASSPGQTPANINGNYRDKIGFSSGSNQLIFGNSAEYSGYLEAGTSRMKARPGLGNTIKASRRNITQRFQNEII